MSEADPAELIRAEYLARVGGPVCESVEEGRVRDFLMALDEPCDRMTGQPVPPLFLLTLGRTRRPQPSRGSAVNAGNDYEFLAPVYVGDQITVSRSVLSVEPKEGKAGRMYLLLSQATYTNQRDEIVGYSRIRILRWGW